MQGNVKIMITVSVIITSIVIVSMKIRNRRWRMNQVSDSTVKTPTISVDNQAT